MVWQGNFKLPCTLISTFLKNGSASIKPGQIEHSVFVFFLLDYNLCLQTGLRSTECSVVEKHC